MPQQLMEPKTPPGNNIRPVLIAPGAGGGIAGMHSHMPGLATHITNAAISFRNFKKPTRMLLSFFTITSRGALCLSIDHGSSFRPDY